jgi:hypothetical protein
MLSNFLIQENFSEFEFESDQENQIITKINYLQSNRDYTNSLIEHNKNNLFDQEIKYKIFEDISSIIKKDNMIELVLNIPIENNIISINKIKISTKLNKYIKDIFICIDNEKIIINTNLNKKKNNSLILIEPNYSQKIINCQNINNITLHILLDNNVINKIINKYIFVNYSFEFYKNKIKFI